MCMFTIILNLVRHHMQEDPFFFQMGGDGEGAREEVKDMFAPVLGNGDANAPTLPLSPLPLPTTLPKEYSICSM